MYNKNMKTLAIFLVLSYLFFFVEASSITVTVNCQPCTISCANPQCYVVSGNGFVSKFVWMKILVAYSQNLG